MTTRSIAVLLGIASVIATAGCASNGKSGGGAPSLADIKAQAAAAQANNQKAIDVARSNPNLSDDQKSAMIARLSGAIHGHGKPRR